MDSITVGLRRSTELPLRKPPVAAPAPEHYGEIPTSAPVDVRLPVSPAIAPAPTNVIRPAVVRTPTVEPEMLTAPQVAVVSRPPDPPRSPRTSSAKPRRGWHTTGVLLSISAAAIAVLLGYSLPEGDADSNPPEAAAKSRGNRLSKETSPYLLAHAQNPVDWYPWGPEALEKARKEQKPIFLSIGYSSCHWCHVMEKRVFSDPEIARYMNEHFVNIKVDREERPDIDEVYMTALQVYFEALGSSQSGGWPMSIFLTPDGRPLGGGTYFAPSDEEGRTGFPTFMQRVADAWRDNRKQMETNADILADGVRKASRPRAALKPVALDRAAFHSVLKKLEGTYDKEYGGFGFSEKSPDRPKFPVPTKLALLQYESRRRDAEGTAKMLYSTLDHMAAGGIHDQVGGGFHRYSTDRYWKVPHFEKMLYDNAQLADVYAEAFRQTGDAHYRAVSEGTIGFVLRELCDPQGAFYASLDADSEGVEGKYYVWTDAELASVLTLEERDVTRAVYGTGNEPAFEAGHVLHQVRSLDDASRELEIPAVELERRLGEIHRKLLAARQQRQAPTRDEKILTSWNGLMIRALARAGVIFENTEYVRAAARAAEFILTQMRDDKGRLYRSYCAGKAGLTGYLDDYAFLIEGLLALHLATGEEKWLHAARRLADQQLQSFWDDTGKACYFTAHEHESLLARTKNAYDSVLPSGNSVTVRNLVRLTSLTRERDYRARAREILELFVPAFEGSPTGMTNMALALAEFVDTPEPAQDRSSSVRRSRVGIAPDPEVLQAGGAAPAKAPKGKTKPAAPEIVTAKAYLSTDRLPAGGSCKVLVQLQVAEGWHIHANPAGDPDFDIPTELAVESQLGTELTKVRYPAGKKVPRGDEEKPQLQYAGKASLLGILEVPADAAGQKEELTVRVTYQACNDQKCLAPKTIDIHVPVVVAARGEKVKPVNEKLFPPETQKQPQRRESRETE